MVVRSSHYLVANSCYFVTRYSYSWRRAAAASESNLLRCKVPITMDTTTPSPSKRQVITFVMTTQYNGFAYAGFQRQTRTPTSMASSNEEDSTATTGKKRKQNNHTNQEVQAAKNDNKSGRKSNAVVTVQDQIENALQKWTGLSLLTLRVRGAGRTDKGVHATHQVVAFDVPLSLVIDHDGGEANNNEEEDRGDDMKISAHALPLLKEAHQTLAKHKPTSTDTSTRPFIDQWKIRRAISTRLPTDIVIRTIRMWNGSAPFEARQNVACKTYIYRLRFRCIAYESNAKSTEGQTYLHPICNAGPHLLRRLNDNNTVWLSQWPLDKEKLRQACEPFVGRHNFCNFVHKAERKVGNSRPSLVRRRERYEQSTSKDADDENDDDKFLMDLFEFNLHMQPEEEHDKTFPPIIDATFSLKAKGFHRSQVRNLVGFVVDVARGERSLDDAKALLGESDTADDEKSLPTVNSAPASGLCLANVEYEHDDFL